MKTRFDALQSSKTVPYANSDIFDIFDIFGRLPFYNKRESHKKTVFKYLYLCQNLRMSHSVFKTCKASSSVLV